MKTKNLYVELKSYERREELVDMAVDTAECIAEYITCDAFERREINLYLVHGYILS